MLKLPTYIVLAIIVIGLALTAGIAAETTRQATPQLIHPAPIWAPDVFRDDSAKLGSTDPVTNQDSLAELQANTHLITLTVNVADDDPVTVMVPTGALATYRSYRHEGYVVGLIPRVTDLEAGAVTVEVVKIRDARQGKVVVERAVATLDGMVGFASITAAHRGLPLAVTVEGYQQASRDIASKCTAPSELLGGGGSQNMMPIGFGTGCCVSCGDGETCGCVVYSSCGSCCGECGGC